MVVLNSSTLLLVTAWVLFKDSKMAVKVGRLELALVVWVNCAWD